MNGLNSSALHVGVDPVLPLAGISGRSAAIGWAASVGGFLPMVEVVLLCDNVHCRYFAGAARRCERAAESLSLPAERRGSQLRTVWAPCSNWNIQQESLF